MVCSIPHDSNCTASEDKNNTTSYVNEQLNVSQNSFDQALNDQITISVSVLAHKFRRWSEDNTVTPLPSSDEDDETSTIQQFFDHLFAPKDEKTSRNGQQTNIVASYTECDVLCGCGAKTDNHPGNLEYRMLVDLHREEYFAARRFRKVEISQDIVGEICSSGGRFLEHNERTGTWYEIGNSKAVEKTSQALREGMAQKLRDILSSNGRQTTPNSPPTVRRVNFVSAFHVPTSEHVPPVPFVPFGSSSLEPECSGATVGPIRSWHETGKKFRPPMRHKKRLIEVWQTGNAGDTDTVQAKRIRRLSFSPIRTAHQDDD